MVNLSVQMPDEEKKSSQIFIFKCLCGASKGFMKTKTFCGTTKKYENENFT